MLTLAVLARTHYVRAHLCTAARTHTLTHARWHAHTSACTHTLPPLRTRTLKHKSAPTYACKQAQARTRQHSRLISRSGIPSTERLQSTLRTVSKRILFSVRKTSRRGGSNEYGHAYSHAVDMLPSMRMSVAKSFTSRVWHLLEQVRTCCVVIFFSCCCCCCPYFCACLVYGACARAHARIV